jgi:hypothetical protein
MRHPSRHEREALVELLLALGGPLVWTGPVPYDALRARHEQEQRGRSADAAARAELVPSADALPLQRSVAEETGATPAPAQVPPVTGSCAA